MRSLKTALFATLLATAATSATAAPLADVSATLDNQFESIVDLNAPVVQMNKSQLLDPCGCGEKKKKKKKGD